MRRAALESNEQRLERRMALRRIPCEAARDRGPRRGNATRCELRRARAGRWSRAGQRFDEREAKAELIRALVDDLAVALLGSHVGRRSDDLPIAREL